MHSRNIDTSIFPIRHKSPDHPCENAEYSCATIINHLFFPVLFFISPKSFYKIYLCKKNKKNAADFMVHKLDKAENSQTHNLNFELQMILSFLLLESGSKFQRKSIRKSNLYQAAERLREEVGHKEFLVAWCHKYLLHSQQC